MRIVTAHLESISPYGQSKYIEAKRGDKESAADFERAHWRDRCHVDDKGVVFIPPMCFKKALEEAAEFLSQKIQGKGNQTWTKHFIAGILVTDGLSLGIKKEDVQGTTLFVPADGKKGGGKRVEKTFPTFQHWDGDVTYYVLDDTITPEAFEYHLRESGNFIGLGFFRPRRAGYWGRYSVRKITWESNGK